MFQKSLNNIIKYCPVIFLLMFSCNHQTNRRNFFVNMKERYPDMHLSPRTFFIKSFGLASVPQKIDGQNYWLLSSSDTGSFYLKGYIRMTGDSMVISPYNYLTNDNYKLFDFDAKIGDSWKLIFQKSDYREAGDSVSFVSKKIVNNDTLYYYSLTPIYHVVSINKFFYDNFGAAVTVEVSKLNGIISITKFNDLYPKHIALKAQFLPKIQFINNEKGAIEL